MQSVTGVLVILPVYYDIRDVLRRLISGQSTVETERSFGSFFYALLLNVDSRFSSAMPQLGHGAGMQLLGMQPAASAHLLLSQSAAPIELIWMSFNLRLDRLLPEHVVGMVVSPCQKFSSGSLPSLQHIA